MKEANEARLLGMGGVRAIFRLRGSGGGGLDSQVSEFVDSAEGEPEEVGTVQAAITAKSEITRVSSPAGNIADTTAAWIKTEESSGAETAGVGLVAFARPVGSGSRVGWIRSTNFQAASPTWSATTLYSDQGAAKWPAPENLCEIYPGMYECDGTGNGWNSFQSGSQAIGRYSGKPKALWTGLDNVAAIVSLCGETTAGDDDVCIATSIDGGASFTRTQVLSVRAEDGLTSTGLRIDPDSLHASLAFSPLVSSGIAGDVGLPIYVTWRNFDPANSNTSWWFTRVIVGVSGTVAETSPPRPISVVPAGTTLNPTIRNRVNIFGTLVDGFERIYIAWSEHPSFSNVSCSGTTAPDPAESVTWFISQSTDYGESWDCFTGLDEAGCFVGSSGSKTTIATDLTWQNCVGPNRTPPTSTTIFRSVNDSRPAVAVGNAALDNSGLGDLTNQYWFIALGKTTGTQQRIQVYRGGGFGLLGGGSDTYNHFLPMALSPLETGLIDSWAPAVEVFQRPGVAEGRGVFAWRNGFSGASPNLAIRALDWRVGLTTSTTTIGSVFNVSAKTPFENTIGSDIGLAHHQQCSNSGIEWCPSGLSFAWPNMPFFLSWPDGRSTGSNGDVTATGLVL